MNDSPENDPYLPLSNAQVTRAFLSIMFAEWTVDELSYMHHVVMHPSYD